MQASVVQFDDVDVVYALQGGGDTIRLSREYLGLKADPKPSDMYTNEFVEGAVVNPEWAYSGK